MFKLITSLVGLVIIIGGILFAYHTYSSYKERQAERVARMQQKVEEVTVTTIEGWTVKKIAVELEEKGFGDAADIEDAIATFDASAFPLVQRPAAADTLEGYLFPDTYRFAKTETIESVIGKMLKNFSDRLKTINVTAYSENITVPGYESLQVSGGDGKPGMSLYDIITLASIIEQESGGKGAVSNPDMTLDEERRLVAGVFYNRLSIGQALESDATVNYVTGKNTPGASLKDLEVNSPYNTYKYAGLPPGPICNPSLGSIAAALKPTENDFYYFLHKQPSGMVEFSKTFEEHRSKR